MQFSNIVYLFFVLKWAEILSIMNKITIRNYNETDFEAWNQMVSEAKNSTFLFDRRFMEYHQERFQDFSLMAFDEKNELIAILPAHKIGNEVYSHLGLTYGGIITKKDLRATVFFDVFSEILKFLFHQGILFLHWKEVPYFYHSYPSDEWKYLAFVTESELYRRDLCAVVNLREEFKISDSVIRNAKWCENQGYYYQKSEQWKEFWEEILTPELEKRHQAKPVHQLEEILRLKANFEGNIFFYGVFLANQLLGGTVVFVNKKVIHSQYISVKSEFKNKKVLDFLHYKLIKEEFKDFDYFDFGISNEENGRKTNMGLLFWKEGFGARGISQDFYKISTKNFSLIEEMFL